MGIGLLESAYEACLADELATQGLSVAGQRILPIVYGGTTIDDGSPPDLIVNNELLIQLKTVSQLLPIHEAQVQTYLRLSGIERGLLVNFNCQPLVKGIRRIVLSRLPP